MAKNKQNGPIGITVGADPDTGQVLVGFSTALNRIELSPQSARDIAKHLCDRADIAEGLVPPTDKIKPIDFEGVPV